MSWSSNGNSHSRAAELSPEDQRVVWTVATLMLDVVSAYGETVAKFLMDKMPQLPTDEAMVKALEDHATADAREVLITLRAGINPSSHEAPIEAIAHARYLRQRGVGMDTLTQVYQYGFAMFRELILEELKDRCSDPGQLSRLSAAVDEYSFPFVAKALQRLAYEFDSQEATWEPSTSDAVLTNEESRDAARRLRQDRIDRGRWVARSVEDSMAHREAEQVLEDFVAALENGIKDRGLADRLTIANTRIAITLADEPDLAFTLKLDRTPIDVLDGVVDPESQMWIASADLPRLWSPDFFLPMAIAKGRVRVEGNTRKFLRILPILRTAGTAPSASVESLGAL